MEGQIHQAIGRAIAERMQLLEQAIVEGNADSMSMGAILLALIGTKESTDKLLRLIKQGEGNPELQDALATAFIGFSPHRYVRRHELFNLFPKNQREYLHSTYKQFGKVDRRILTLPSLLEAITKAIDWANDDSGD